MNLQDFYNSLPEQTAPKSDWVRSVAEKLGVSEVTVRTWVYGRNKPREKRLLKGLSEITGIPEDKLFN
ncbi:MAG TPA: helix-turn-helix transcriptional regulator [Candidatus Kapabacteria bacterium]|mgnify:FL=1|nr:helix-turn-helix transcriptional regulator [Candidatus Kapabacteria bacterium]